LRHMSGMEKKRFVLFKCGPHGKFMNMTP